MDVNVVVKLIDAGFTRDDIMKIAGSKAPESPVQSPAEAEVVKPEVKAPEQPSPANPEPAPAPLEDKISEAVTAALKPFENLYNQMAKLANMPSLENIQPKGIDDIVAKFFEGE